MEKKIDKRIARKVRPRSAVDKVLGSKKPPIKLTIHPMIKRVKAPA